MAARVSLRHNGAVDVGISGTWNWTSRWDVRVQLISLDDDERRQLLARLEPLAKNPDGAGLDSHKSRDDAQLWTVRLSPQTQALVRAEVNLLRLLCHFYARSIAAISDTRRSAGCLMALLRSARPAGPAPSGVTSVSRGGQ